MNYIVQVNKVKGKEGNIRAYANIVLDEVFKITNIAIIENSEKGQLFVSMPRYRTKLVDENNRPVYRDICYPITKEFREKIYEIIFETHQKELEKAKWDAERLPNQSECVRKDVQKQER